ncbi:MAG: TdeIII family type II restriction endonuclease [Chloroflexi bacterium]|nr:TdeIII family type II restriction endonuclease [Chloroflexota bacterium]
MGISGEKKDLIVKVLKDSIENKFKNYKPETKHMPFHYRLIGKDRMALFSFIHSLNTTFGTSIYEPVAIALAQDIFIEKKKQEDPHTVVSSEAHGVIQNIIDGISVGDRTPDKIAELEEIRNASNLGRMNNVNLTKIDIWLKKRDGVIYFIDLKTVKPNVGGFQNMKRTLLEWAATEFAKNPDVQIKTMLGIPYNPYHPKPYQRWTMRGMFDLKEEILVAEELWDFIGGEGSYDVLLDCFEQAGIELRPKIDEYFSRFDN